MRAQKGIEVFLAIRKDKLLTMLKWRIGATNNIQEQGRPKEGAVFLQKEGYIISYKERGESNIS